MKNTNTYLEELKSGALNGRMIEIYGCDEKKAQEYNSRFPCHGKVLPFIQKYSLLSGV